MNTYVHVIYQTLKQLKTCISKLHFMNILNHTVVEVQIKTPLLV